LLRQYSLSGDPEDRFTYRIAVRRLGIGSQEVHSLAEGDVVTVHGPRNAFPFIRAPRYLFIAGGIGILPMLHAAADADWYFVYCGRSRASMPFLDEIERLDPDRVWIRPDDEYGMPVSGAELLTLNCWTAVVEGAALTWLQERNLPRAELEGWLVDQLLAMVGATAGHDTTVAAVLARTTS
jgi:hypothetical protein